MAYFIKHIGTGFIVTLLLLMLDFIGKCTPRQKSYLSAKRQVNTDILSRKKLLWCFQVTD